MKKSKKAEIDKLGILADKLRVGTWELRREPQYQTDGVWESDTTRTSVRQGGCSVEERPSRVVVCHGQLLAIYGRADASIVHHRDGSITVIRGERTEAFRSKHTWRRVT